MKTIFEELNKTVDDNFCDKDFCCCGYEYCYPTNNEYHDGIKKIKSVMQHFFQHKLEAIKKEIKKLEEDNGFDGVGYKRAIEDVLETFKKFGI